MSRFILSLLIIFTLFNTVPAYVWYGTLFFPEVIVDDKAREKWFLALTVIDWTYDTDALRIIKLAKIKKISSYTTEDIKNTKNRFDKFASAIVILETRALRYNAESPMTSKKELAFLLLHECLHVVLYYRSYRNKLRDPYIEYMLDKINDEDEDGINNVCKALGYKY